VESNGRFLRVQVKSTSFWRNGAYACNIVGPKGERYARGRLDFFAVYLVPVDVWYIVPFDVVERNCSLNLTPRKGHKFSQYMEAWNLLRGQEKVQRKKTRGRVPGGGGARQPLLKCKAARMKSFGEKSG